MVDTSQVIKTARDSTQARPWLTVALLLLCDLALLSASAWLGAQAWQLFRPLTDLGEFYSLWPLLLIFPLGYALLGLYPAAGIHPVEELKHLSQTSTAVYLLAVLISFLLQQDWLNARGSFVSAGLLTLLLVPLGRTLLRWAFADKPWWGVPVLVLGAGKTAQLLLERLNEQPGLGLKPVACLDDDKHTYGSLAGVSVVGPLSETTRLAREYRVRHALVAMPGVHPSHLTKLLRRYASVFPHLIVVPDMFGVASLSVQVRDLSGIIGLHARQNLLLRHNRIFKRLLDLALLVPAALLAIVPIIFACLWILVVSPGSPFYAQKREGYGGKTVRVWKLRTMYKDADRLLERHLAENPEAKQEWERFYKLRHDPRLLKGAGLLRKLSIDELPQLYNVLKGEMSFVGPRPFPYYHLEQFDEAFRSLRTEVKPGITGLWQVSARSDGDLALQERLDGYYIRNWSFWLDIYILARTPWTVLTGKGAY